MDWLRDIAHGVVMAFVALVVIIVLFFGLTWGYHTWYVDTHCTTVLGTQVCQ